MSNLYTFTGGVRIPRGASEKSAGLSPIKIMPAPACVRISLREDTELSVSAGDHVFMGQLLCAETDKNPIHSSVSGKITEIFCDCNGKPEAVMIENDGEDARDGSILPFNKKLTETAPDEIVEIIRRAGICESEDGFSVSRRIECALGGARRLLINCTECEPFLSSRYRLILEHPTDVLNGAKILLRALEVAYADIVIEESRIDAIRVLEEVIGNNPLLRLRVTSTKYPQGDRRLIINSVTGKEPPARETTAQLGYVVFSAEVCADIFRAFAGGMPQTERIVTVAGDCIEEPSVLSVRVGTPISEIVKFCGGLTRQPARVICGSTMKGVALPDGEYYISKKDTAFLFLSKKYIRSTSASACLRCGKCVDNCPMHLLPLYLAKHAEKGSIKKALAMGLKSCIECGTCTYNCPGGVEHVYHIRRAKESYNSERSREEGNE